MKQFTIIFFLVIVKQFSAQEKIEKTKIGEYQYEFFLKEIYFYEDDEYGINYYIRLKDKKQFVGTNITYRTFIRSRNAPIVNQSLPPNSLLKFKDREVTGIGKIDIKKDSKEIISTFKRYVKNNESEADSTKTIYKQRKDGFFENMLFIEYKNGKEKIIEKK
ncbi:hypothetical protein LPB85_10950 [Chryseobacterium sp. LC2016-27]|uniref:hypothetical protein n=1 Tax=Chryseobacterium sp. LC2016-27 TaxID=2897326 RepID=UPI001E28B15B|nr:hypothetical protein [Chryseobacterium sp. LC2016-27]MCD0455952.1 hypothetical protein [Chryseobacterium sp. LC2016-27]